ncbi:hypothetical protein FO519_004780 [Halicephalobus sp. NKZ332]|nr:hypothetical protein FO519_004780 [Halicephalobus sp. NKZ332]
MVEIDKDFPKALPFGFLKTLHWAAPLAFVITIYAGSFVFGGIPFSLLVAWNAFVYSLITWICYLLQLNKKTFQVGQGVLWIPFALMDFLVSALLFVLFSIVTLICVICIFESFKYRIGVFLTYLFATAFALVAGAAYGYYALRLYQACPNGQLKNLSTLVVEGTTTSTKDTFVGASTTTRPTA